jgi:ketosteroid isomerase-like protein
MPSEGVMATATDARTVGHRDAAAAWVAMFAEGWANPVDADTFCDHFEPWLDPEMRMVQPQMNPVVGLRAFREEFARPLFELVPDLRGTVEGWSSTRDVIYIELRLEGTVGKRRFEMPTCDRITLRDGRATERIAYLDATPLVTAILRSPQHWARFARMQLQSRRRGAR